MEITSDSFYANENSLYTVFSGNVKVKDSSGELSADKLTVFFTKDRKPIKLEATGNINVTLKTKEGKEFEGSGNKLILYPKDERVELEGNAFISEKNSANKISGEKVEFNKKSGEARVFGGGGKPAKFTIEVNEGSN